MQNTITYENKIQSFAIGSDVSFPPPRPPAIAPAIAPSSLSLCVFWVSLV